MKLRYLWLLAVLSGLALFISPAVSAAAISKSAIAAGYFHTLAIQKDGSLWASGRNDYGQLGLGDTRIAHPHPGWHRQKLGGCGHRLSSQLGAQGRCYPWAWGSNSFGQLGLNDTDQRHTPSEVGNGYVGVAAGNNHTLALKAECNPWAWGHNGVGQVGLDDTTHDYHAPVQVGIGCIGVAAGDIYSLGFLVNGSLYAWGRNIYGQ